MADNDNENDDEYKLDESDSGYSSDEAPKNQDVEPSLPPPDSGSDIRKKALLVVGVFVSILLLYKLYGVFFSGKPTPVETTKPAVAIQQPMEPVIVPAIEPTTTMPVAQPQPIQTNEIDEMKKNISAVQLSQSTLRNDVDSMNVRLNAIESTLSQLNTKLETVAATINSLSEKIDEKVEVITLLQARLQPKRVVHRPRVHAPRVYYFIQAIIPGRAWLVATNGTTITVREGSQISGFGTVRLIDAAQGRVLMSSGAIIRFNQADS